MADSFTIKSRYFDLDGVVLSSFLRATEVTLTVTWSERNMMENGEAGDSNLPEGYSGVVKVTGVIKGAYPAKIWHDEVLTKAGDEVPFALQADSDRAAVVGTGDANAPLYTGYVSVASVGTTNGAGVTYFEIDVDWNTSRSLYYDIGAGPVLLEGPPAL